MKTKFSGILTLLLAFVVQITFAQEKTITGTVSDESGPLPGVSVLVKGTSNGTETDFDGKYSIRAKQGDVLRFSFVGMKTKEITIGASNNINLTLEGDNILDEVVVTALGIKREAKSLGYSQQTVKGEDLSKTRQTDLSTAVAGKVSGIQFVGQPSSTFKASQVRLRGGSDVLYVVDGVKITNSQDVNMNEVESMSVLKSLAATALYGPDGRNGAVIITTKKAKNGESTITLNSSVEFGNAYIMPEHQNEYGGGYANDGKPSGDPRRNTSAIGEFSTFSFNPTTMPSEWASFDGQQYPTYSADESWGPRLEGQLVRHWDSWIPNDPEFGKLRAWSPNPNNIRDFYKTSISSNNTVNFAKGGEGYNVRAGVTYIDQSLILENTNRNTILLNLNTDYNLTEKVKFVANVNFRNDETLNDPDNQYGNLGSNFNQWWQRQIDMNRLRNYRRNGIPVSWNINSPTNSRPLYWNSPYFEVYENIKNDYRSSIYGSVGLEYEINDNLTASLKFRKFYRFNSGNDRTGWGGLDQERYTEYKGNGSRDELFGILNYSKKIDKIDLQGRIGFETTSIDRNFLNNSSVGGLTTPGFYSIATSKDRPNVLSYSYLEKRKAWFVNASVGYDDLIFIDGSYRTDYGSTARPDKNDVVTKGLSASFIPSKFIENKDILSFAKLKVGYAEAPYFPVPYQLSQTYAAGTPYGSAGTSTVPNTGINPSLEGGVLQELEYGAEFKFFKNRIGLDVVYFDRERSKIPSLVTLPGTTGITGFFSNEGIQTYKGIEASLNVVPVKTENLTWDITFNAATLKRTVVKIADGVDRNVLSSWGPQLLEQKGEEWGSIYGNAYKRDENGNRILAANGLYERENNKYLGSILPDLTGGISTNLTYKNFDLNLGFDYQFGGKMYTVSRRYGNYSGLGIETVGNNALGNPVRNEITGTNKPTAWSVNLDNAAPNSGGQLTSGVDENGNPQQFLVNPFILWRSNLRNIHEEFVKDASYFKLRTIRLGYNLPKKFLKKAPITSLNVALFANNVWLIHTEVDGVDPSELEGRVQSGINNTSTRYTWIENGQMPNTRTFGFNLKATF